MVEIHWEQLRELMKFRGYTYPKLAEVTKMSKSTLQKLLSGQSDDTRIGTLYPVVLALGASFDRLLGLAPPRDYREENRAYDANLMETMQTRLTKHETTIEEQRQKIHDLDVEIGTLNERLAAKRETIAELKEQCHAANAMSESLRADLRRYRVVSGVLAFCTLAVFAYLIWEVSHIEKGITGLLHM